MGTLPGWNRKKGLLGNHFLAILQKHGKKICYNTRRINVTLTMPTALLRWDPDLQPGNRSSDDAAGGSVLQSGDQHKMLLSFHQIAASSTIENLDVFLLWTKNTGELQVACPVWYSVDFLEGGAFSDRLVHITVRHNWQKGNTAKCDSKMMITLTTHNLFSESSYAMWWNDTLINTHMVHFPYPLHRTVVFSLPACSAKSSPAVLVVWHPVRSHSVICKWLSLCCLVRQQSRH